MFRFVFFYWNVQNIFLFTICRYAISVLNILNVWKNYDVPQYFTYDRVDREKLVLKHSVSLFLLRKMEQKKIVLY